MQALTRPVSQKRGRCTSKAWLSPRTGNRPGYEDGPPREWRGPVRPYGSAGASALGGGVPLGDVRPVHDVPPGLDVVRLDVLVLEVESVLPDINTNDRYMGYHSVSLCSFGK